MRRVRSANSASRFVSDVRYATRAARPTLKWLPTRRSVSNHRAISGVANEYDDDDDERRLSRPIVAFYATHWPPTSVFFPRCKLVSRNRREPWYRVSRSLISPPFLAFLSRERSPLSKFTRGPFRTRSASSRVSTPDDDSWPTASCHFCAVLLVRTLLTFLPLSLPTQTSFLSFSLFPRATNCANHFPRLSRGAK